MGKTRECAASILELMKNGEVSANTVKNILMLEGYNSSDIARSLNWLKEKGIIILSGASKYKLTDYGAIIVKDEKFMKNLNTNPRLAPNSINAEWGERFNNWFNAEKKLATKKIEKEVLSENEESLRKLILALNDEAKNDFFLKMVSQHEKSVIQPTKTTKKTTQSKSTPKESQTENYANTNVIIDTAVPDKVQWRQDIISYAISEVEQIKSLKLERNKKFKFQNGNRTIFDAYAKIDYKTYIVDCRFSTQNVKFLQYFFTYKSLLEQRGDNVVAIVVIIIDDINKKDMVESNVKAFYGTEKFELFVFETNFLMNKYGKEAQQ